MSAVWRKELYQVLEKDNNATHYESLIAVIRVLLKHGIRLSVLIERVMQDEQAGDQEWWFSIYQGVIINMLAEDTKSIKEYKCLIESFVNILWFVVIMKFGSNEDTEYQERCLKIIIHGLNLSLKKQQMAAVNGRKMSCGGCFNN